MKHFCTTQKHTYTQRGGGKTIRTNVPKRTYLHCHSNLYHYHQSCQHVFRVVPHFRMYGGTRHMVILICGKRTKQNKNVRTICFRYWITSSRIEIIILVSLDVFLLPHILTERQFAVHRALVFVAFNLNVEWLWFWIGRCLIRAHIPTFFVSVSWLKNECVTKQMNA